MAPRFIVEGGHSLRGTVPFACPYCEQSHAFTLDLRRRKMRVGYVPTLWDPLGATSLAYHRKLRVPLVCPRTRRPFQGVFVVDQTSREPVINIEVAEPA